MNEAADCKPGEESARYVGEIIRRRRSTRHFTGDPVPREALRALVEAGVQAPSGSNTQNPRFLILDDRDALARLDSVRFVWPYRNYTKRKDEPDRVGIIGSAAAAILVFADASLTGAKDGGEHHIWRALDNQNASAAIENMLLMATAMGLGTCWVSATEEMSHSRLLSGQSWRSALPDYNIPSDYHIQGIVIVGHARKTDPDGFPAGERMHGVDWTPTARQAVETYLIEPSATLPRETPRGLKRLWRRTLVACVRGLLHLTHRLERAIHRIEAPDLTTNRDELSH